MTMLPDLFSQIVFKYFQRDNFRLGSASWSYLIKNIWIIVFVWTFSSFDKGNLTKFDIYKLLTDSRNISQNFCLLQAIRKLIVANFCGSR